MTAFIDGLNTIVVKLAKKADILSNNRTQGFKVTAFYEEVPIKKVEPVLPKINKNLNQKKLGMNSLMVAQK